MASCCADLQFALRPGWCCATARVLLGAGAYLAFQLYFVQHTENYLPKDCPHFREPELPQRHQRCSYEALLVHQSPNFTKRSQRQRGKVSTGEVSLATASSGPKPVEAARAVMMSSLALQTSAVGVKPMA